MPNFLEAYGSKNSELCINDTMVEQPLVLWGNQVAEVISRSLLPFKKSLLERLLQNLENFLEAYSSKNGTAYKLDTGVITMYPM